MYQTAISSSAIVVVDIISIVFDIFLINEIKTKESSSPKS